MEDKGTGRRTDVRLSGLRENSRQPATAADGWLRGAVAAWNRRPRGRWLANCSLGLCEARCRFEVRAVPPSGEIKM